MTLQSTDLLLVERGGAQYKMTPDALGTFLGAIRDESVANIAARDGLTGLSEGDRVFVGDASADASVDAGWAVYRYNGTDFDKIQEQESLDVSVSSGGDLGYSASSTQGVITNTGGTDATIPAVTASNAGLATPDMLNNSHAPVTVVVGGPLTRTAQLIGFSLAALTLLP